MNSGHRWTGQESYDAWHMEEEAFLEKYPDINADALRLKKKRDSKGAEPADGYIGLRIAYWDIETTGFKADFDRILCASVADGFGDVKTFRAIDFPQENPLDDRGICVALRDYLMNEFDVIVGWNSKLFDRDFLNTRLVVEHNEEPLRERLHIDAMYLIAQGKMGRSLDNVARALRVTDVTKSHFDKRIWAMANMGDERALGYITDHCERDVLVLRRVFEKLRPQVKTVHR